jgi:hypothetical protein
VFQKGYCSADSFWWCENDCQLWTQCVMYISVSKQVATITDSLRSIASINSLIESASCSPLKMSSIALKSSSTLLFTFAECVPLKFHQKFHAFFFSFFIGWWIRNTSTALPYSKALIKKEGGKKPTAPTSLCSLL